MSTSDKRLEAMRRNPQGDWTMSDIQALCLEHGVACEAPRRGSHYTLRHSSVVEILTIPSRRPIKPVYVRKLVKFIDAVVEADDDPA